MAVGFASPDFRLQRHQQEIADALLIAKRDLAVNSEPPALWNAATADGDARVDVHFVHQEVTNGGLFGLWNGAGEADVTVVDDDGEIAFGAFGEEQYGDGDHNDKDGNPQREIGLSKHFVKLVSCGSCNAEVI